MRGGPWHSSQNTSGSARATQGAFAARPAALADGRGQLLVAEGSLVWLPAATGGRASLTHDGGCGFELQGTLGRAGGRARRSGNPQGNRAQGVRSDVPEPRVEPSMAPKPSLFSVRARAKAAGSRGGTPQSALAKQPPFPCAAALDRMNASRKSHLPLPPPRTPVRVTARLWPRHRTPTRALRA